MAKKITKKIKLQIQAAKATPAPPLGPALGQAGINIGDFVTKFNPDIKPKICDKRNTCMCQPESLLDKFKL